MVSLVTTEERGSIHIPLLGVLTVLFILGLGAWSTLRLWRFKLETQLRLDRCVGLAAQGLRETIHQVEDGNQKLLNLRKAIGLAHLQPELIPPLRKTAQAVAGLQIFRVNRWNLQRHLGWAKRGCGRFSDRSAPLPFLNYERKPEDLLGPQLLEWRGEMPTHFHLQCSNTNRFSAARIYRNDGEIQNAPFQTLDWAISWTIPNR